MSSQEKTSKKLKISLLYLVIFAAYNILLFVIAGFTGHGASFWISYAFVLLAFAALAVSGLMVKNMNQKDWLFGYPLIKHSVIYGAVELALSVLFMCLDIVNLNWAFAVVFQLIVFVVYLVFAISCLLAHETIAEVSANVKKSVKSTRLLQIDVETLAAKAQDPIVKDAFTKLAEHVRYSDPMGNDALYDLESQIRLQVENADRYLILKDEKGALQCCQKAALLLQERNKKCMALK